VPGTKVSFSVWDTRVQDYQAFANATGRQWEKTAFCTKPRSSAGDCVLDRFAANQFGLFDIGGNVWQWCEDEYSPGDDFRVLRGASWDSYNGWWKSQTPLQDILLSSSRNIRAPASIATIIGFRVVLAETAARLNP